MSAGFIASAWDLLHPGHIFTIKQCQKLCTRLMIGLHSDPTIDRPMTKNRPVQTLFERWVQLKHISGVDTIIPYDTEEDLENIYATLDIKIRFIGEDHKDDKNTGDDICEHRGIKTIFIPRLHSFSTSSLRKRIGG